MNGTIHYNPLRSQMTKMVQVEMDRLQSDRKQISHEDYISQLRELANIVNMLEPNAINMWGPPPLTGCFPNAEKTAAYMKTGPGTETFKK